MIQTSLGSAYDIVIPSNMEISDDLFTASSKFINAFNQEIIFRYAALKEKILEQKLAKLEKEAKEKARKEEEERKKKEEEEKKKKEEEEAAEKRRQEEE